MDLDSGYRVRRLLACVRNMKLTVPRRVRAQARCDKPGILWVQHEMVAADF